jgi:hypothetical protein
MAKISEQLKAKLKEERKISLEEHCEQHLKNPDLIDGMSSLFAVFRELKMKPSWYYSGKYKCNYKKEVVVYMVVHNDNCKITVATVSAADNTSRYDVNAFVRTLSNELKEEFAAHFKTCSGCSTSEFSCAPGRDIEVGGTVYKNVCTKTLIYTVKNPTTEQFKWIEKFIIARREYINNTKV